MTWAFWLGAGAAYAGAAAAYYHARFRLAALAWLLYGGLVARAALVAVAPVPAALLLAGLFLLPALYLVLHYVDARRGLFYLPTIYSIPLAFLAGLLLWAATGVGLLW